MLIALIVAAQLQVVAVDRYWALTDLVDGADVAAIARVDTVNEHDGTIELRVVVEEPLTGVSTGDTITIRATPGSGAPMAGFSGARVLVFTKGRKLLGGGAGVFRVVDGAPSLGAYRDLRGCIFPDETAGGEELVSLARIRMLFSKRK